MRAGTGVLRFEHLAMAEWTENIVLKVGCVVLMDDAHGGRL